MSLLQTLKSLLGLDGDGGGESRDDVGVTVEREAGTAGPAAETESAAEGVDVEGDASADVEGNGAEPDEATEPSAETADEAIEEAEPERGQSDEIVELDGEDAEAESAAGAEPEPEPEPEAEAEPDTEPGPEDDAEAEDERVEDDEESTDEESEADEESVEGPESDLEDIKGVGPAYADRLRGVGIESIADLAESDAEEIAAETDLSATRVENWIEQAKVR